MKVVNEKNRAQIKDPFRALAALPACQAQEAEKAVVGAMLTDPSIIEEVSLLLKVDDFFHPAYQRLFAILLEMQGKGQVIDVSTVVQYLSDQQQLEAIGGASMLAEIACGIVTVLSFKSHAVTIRKKSLLRKLQQRCMHILQGIHSAEEVEDILNKAEESMAKLVDDSLSIGNGDSGRSTIKTLRDSVIEFVEESENLIGKKNVFNGIPTGFYQLDLLLGGFQPGEYIILAAESGLGKTAFALNLMLNMARRRKNPDTGAWMEPGYKVGIFSIEMNHDQLTKRLLSMDAKMRSGHVRTPQGWSNADFQTVGLAAERLVKFPIVIDSDGHLTPEKLTARARWMKRHHGVDIIFVDYLQLMVLNGTVHGDIETETTRQSSHAIRQTAKALGIPFFVLCQFNKEGLKSGSPDLHHIKGSGQIIQDAHCIMVMQEVEADKRQAGGPMQIKLTIKKSRESERGTYRMFNYEGSIYTFTEQQSPSTSGRQTY